MRDILGANDMFPDYFTARQLASVGGPIKLRLADPKTALKSLQQISSNLTIKNFSYLIFFEKLFETVPKRPDETLAGSCVQIATAVRPISNVSTS